MTPASCQHPKERGNIFFYIFLGISLFAALGYAVSRTSMNANTISDEKARIVAGEIISQVNSVRDNIAKMRLRGVTATQISFVNSIQNIYSNASCTTSACLVFDPAGGGLSWIYPPPEANNGDNWHYGTGNIYGMGLNSNCSTNTPCTDLVMQLPAVNEKVCDKINLMMGVYKTPGSFYYYGPATSTARFSGNYGTGGTGGNNSNGKNIYCYKAGSITLQGATSYTESYIVVGGIYAN